MNKYKAFVSQYFQNEPDKIIPIVSGSGSDRKYFRFNINDKSYILAENPNVRENEAFIYLANHFSGKGLKTPELKCVSDDKTMYILEDLGDYHLYDKIREAGSYNENLRPFYEQALKDLADIQYKGFEGLDTKICYPRAEFDHQSVQWDLNYFKYHFIKLTGLDFDEEALEKEFEKLIQLSTEGHQTAFMYRDFQSRNIMIKDFDLYYIDFQGGRKGPVLYDVVSLLYQVRANIPASERSYFAEYYRQYTESDLGVKFNDFQKELAVMALLRSFQTLGAYGFRGLYEKKANFMLSLIKGMKQCAEIMDNEASFIELPLIRELLEGAINKYTFDDDFEGLTVRINSFSFMKGLPIDLSGNGGGHVFDCRALPNPGREVKFRKYSGLDDEIKIYLEAEDEVCLFLRNVYEVVDISVRKYLSRGFKNLMVNFGCTGGQHRSVFSAEKLRSFIKSKYPEVNIIVDHTNKENWPKH